MLSLCRPPNGNRSFSASLNNIWPLTVARNHPVGSLVSGISSSNGPLRLPCLHSHFTAGSPPPFRARQRRLDVWLDLRHTHTMSWRDLSPAELQSAQRKWLRRRRHHDESAAAASFNKPASLSDTARPSLPLGCSSAAVVNTNSSFPHSPALVLFAGSLGNTLTIA